MLPISICVFWGVLVLGPRCPGFDGDSELRFETPLQCSSPIPGILQSHDLNSL